MTEFSFYSILMTYLRLAAGDLGSISEWTWSLDYEFLWATNNQSGKLPSVVPRSRSHLPVGNSGLYAMLSSLWSPAVKYSHAGTKLSTR